MSSIAKFNRDKLFSQLLPNSIAILFGDKLKYRNNDVAYTFRQNSDFLYLTGFNEPNAIAVFIKGDLALSQDKFILFHQRLDDNYKIWNGAGVTNEQLSNLFGVDESYFTDQIDVVLPGLLSNKDLIYHPLKNNFITNKIKNWQELSLQLAKNKTTAFSKQGVQDLSALIHQLRMIKSDLELEKIRYVTNKSANAHKHIMEYVAKHKNLTERDIQAQFYCYCLQQGCEDMAYTPIVAAGANACVLHYHKNSELLHHGDLLLIDAGAEYCGYAADITRVLPINGKFSSRQKEIYNLVLLAQQQAIAKIAPGELLVNIQKNIVEVLVDGLVDLKILDGSREELINNQAYKSFYMHNFGHFLGLDVHDVSVVDKNASQTTTGIKLEPRMVLTVEPGLYLPASLPIDPVWHDIGIRIEDDILVTVNGAENLTAAAPKEVDEIEYLMLN